MPVYEYRCLECDEVFEQRRLVTDADTATCPTGHKRVKRLLSVFAAARSVSPADTAPSAGGGCCGGACGCR